MLIYGLIALFPLQAMAQATDVPVLKRRTISLSTGGTSSDITLPIGTLVDVQVKARNTVSNPDGSVQLTGQVQLTLALDKLPPLSIFADAVTMRSEVLDAGQAQAVRDLQQMGISDQSLRGNPSAMTAADVIKQENIDKANMQRLAAIIAAYGWPGNRFGGIALANNAFAVLQHADLDSQHRYLPLLRRAVEKNEAHPHDLAMLEDRVLVRDGKPQLYGTQFLPTEPGKPLALYPVQDEAGLAQRRKDLGLAPMAEYLDVLRSVYKKD
jgi:hypothetical protein